MIELFLVAKGFICPKEKSPPITVEDPADGFESILLLAMWPCCPNRGAPEIWVMGRLTERISLDPGTYESLALFLFLVVSLVETRPSCSGALVFLNNFRRVPDDNLDPASGLRAAGALGTVAIRLSASADGESLTSWDGLPPDARFRPEGRDTISGWIGTIPGCHPPVMPSVVEASTPVVCRRWAGMTTSWCEMGMEDRKIVGMTGDSAIFSASGSS